MGYTELGHSALDTEELSRPALLRYVEAPGVLTSDEGFEEWRVVIYQEEEEQTEKTDTSYHSAGPKLTLASLLLPFQGPARPGLSEGPIC